jgi:predicted AAA+ superfamily ATPase
MLNAASLATSLAVDGKTVARYVDLLVDLLLARRLLPYVSNAGKRLVKSPKVYIRDSGLVHALLNIQNRDALLGHPIAGSSWEGFVIESILSVVPKLTVPSFYRTSNGNEIDLILELPNGNKWAIEIKCSLAPKLSKGFHAAAADIVPDRCFVVYAGTERYKLASDVEAIGLQEICNLLLNFA